ncbi:MAG: hypothetical protein M1840_001597 [Geoglossum simile]|nr:MAG: hypothetical protein M1840_001597 [Geoglossum simile]
MSGTVEERHVGSVLVPGGWLTEPSWRGRGQQNSRNPPNQQQRRGGSRERPSAGGYQNQGRQGSGNQGPATIQGNVWAGERPNRGQNSGAMPEEQHVSVRGFNGRETRDALRKGELLLLPALCLKQSAANAVVGYTGFQDAINAADSKPVVYKVSGGESNSARATGPWGSKSNTMANGQDFFVQLRKGMAGLQQGTSTNT